jgi:hypothetical protein
MRRTILIATLLSFLSVHFSSAWAWWDAGHMQIAYVAYRHLDASVRDKVDALLKLNVDYPKWTAGAPDEKTAKLYAFVHAATWADDIKTKDYGYARDNVNSATAGQNIGYTDHNQHAYWHFKDVNFSPDGTPLAPPDPVDIVTQLKLMITGLPASSGARCAFLRSRVDSPLGGRRAPAPACRGQIYRVNSERRRGRERGVCHPRDR